MAKLTIEYGSIGDLQVALRNFLPPVWENIWQDTGIKHGDDLLHIRVNYCSEEDIGYILIALAPARYAYVDVEKVLIREALWGNKKEDIIRHAIKRWDECNTEQYVADFVAKQAEETKTVE